MQNLEKICINLPIFNSVGFGKKAIGKGENMLSYKYRLDHDFSKIKEVNKSKLLGEGWTLISEKRIVADDLIEFKKGDLTIFISNGLYGDENYSVSCQDESIK